MNLCECGCGVIVKYRYKRGHSNFKRKGEGHPLFGKHHSYDTKIKMSNASLGKAKSKQHRENISKGLLGHLVSENSRKIASFTHKGKILSDKQKEILRKRMTGLKLPEEWRKAIGRGNRGKKHTIEQNEKNRIGTINRLMLHPEKHPNVLSHRKTLIEKLVEDWLLKNSINYKYNERVGRYFPDFILLGRNIIIECDEPYWHQKENEKRENFLKCQGYNIYHLTTREIKNKLDNKMRTILGGEN